MSATLEAHFNPKSGDLLGSSPFAHVPLFTIDYDDGAGVSVCLQEWPDRPGVFEVDAFTPRMAGHVGTLSLGGRLLA